MPIARTESVRIRTFRLKIAREIPKFPNDNNNNALSSLESESLATLMVHHTNWAVRCVSSHPRAVHVESTASSDSRWPMLKIEIESFLEKVKRGDDLTPHLSLAPHTRGYTPAPSMVGGQVGRWADKDFLLIVMGYHHFHLSLTIEARGFVTRTDEVLFAKVSRHDFTVMAIFDHSVIKMSRTPNEDMTKERKRLWDMFDAYSTRGLSPGSTYIPAMIATSGHSLHLVQLAQEYARIIRELDPKLDDTVFIQDMFQRAGGGCVRLS
jgi:hypothetical protein